MKDNKIIKMFGRAMAIMLTVMMVATAVDLSSIDAQAAVRVKKVKVVKSSVSVAVGGTATIKASVSPSNASKKTLKYTSSNKSVATVSSKGKITGKKAGTATITVSATDGSKKTAKVKVTVKNVKVKSLSVKAAKTSVTVGKTTTVKVSKVTPANATNKAVKWTSSNTKVATVSSTGKVTAKKIGTVTITATAKDGSKKKASVKIKVVPVYVKSLKITASKKDLDIGETVTAKVSKYNPSNATVKAVKWTSSNPEVATVSSAGKIKAVSAGMTTITAMSKDGKKAKDSFVVIVKAGTEAVVSVEREDYYGLSVKAEDVAVTDEEVDDYLEMEAMVEDMEELTDEYIAATYGSEGITTVAEYRAYVKEELYKENVEYIISDALLENIEIVSYDSDRLAEKTRGMFEFMKAFIEMLEVTMEEYYAETGTTEQELLLECETMAKEALGELMIIEKIAELEGITATDEEFQAELDKVVAENETTEEELFETYEALGYTRDDVKTMFIGEKVTEFIVNNVVVEN